MTDEAWPVVCATGHRPQHLEPAEQAWVRQKLLAAASWVRDKHGTMVGLSGLALGTDTWWAHAVLEVGLTLGAIIPCLQQPDRWPQRDRERWEQLRAASHPDHSTIVAKRYTGPGLLHARNRVMLDRSNAVIVVWKEGKFGGGTWEAIRYADKLGMPAAWLEPASRTVRPFLPTNEIKGPRQWPVATST